MQNLYIVMPAYNESENIYETLEQWYPVVEQVGGDSRIVVVNDGSRDNTYSILQDYAENHERLIPLTKDNGGHGAAVLHGYRYALGKKCDFIFQTDSDGQTDPDEFWQFWEDRDRWDMIIGWRNARQDGLSRVFVTKTLRAVVRACFHVDAKDANTPFRLMSNESLAECLELVPEGFNLANVLLTVIYHKKGLRVRYVPITFKPRQGGVNSINLPRIFGIGRQAFKDFRQANRAIDESLRS